jgi:endonuclease/exonuclease/phosphatase (EEP) superfamily protein YafD
MRVIARWLVATSATMALVVWACFAFGGAAQWWIELLRFVPFPAFLAAAGLALVASAWLGARGRVAAIAALAVVLGPLMGLSVGRADAGSGALRLMTYNVKAYRADERHGGFAPIAWDVLEHDPDVVVMQDAGGMVDAQGQASDPAIKEVFAKRQVYANGQYVVASRFPLKDCAPGRMDYGGQVHTYVRCTLQAHGVEVDLVTAHLKSPREGLNAARHEGLAGLDEWHQNYLDRLQQVGALVGALAGRTRPLILAGDLNAVESSPVVRGLKELGLRDAFGSAGLGYGYTIGQALRTRIPLLRIDHVLVSEDIGVHDAFTGVSNASEHRPVIADLLLHRQAD